MAVDLQVPPLGESVTQATLLSWYKEEGQSVSIDEPICELETDKANVDLPAKAAGVLRRLKQPGDVVQVGEVIARIDETAGAAVAAASAPAVEAKAPAALVASPLEDLSPAVRRLVEENHLDPKAIGATGPGGRLTKEDVENHLRQQGRDGKALPAPAPAPVASPPVPAPKPAPAPAPAQKAHGLEAHATGGALAFDASGIARVPMSKIRKRIAERLLQAQQTAAILTTFNEVDLTELMAIRSRYKDRFQEVHGVGLGFMSFFASAVAMALREIPSVNAFIEGDEIVYHNYVNLGIAVSTERGLAVPVLRNVQDMSFAKIESEVKRVATAVRDGKLGLDELSGGTFTITNGGVFGSLLSTPILSPPQSGILGMHNIQKRPVVIGERIEVRSMMYVALSYDHRLVDGREAITFLVRVKQMLEDPARMVVGV